MTSRTMITNESWSCDTASPEWDLQHIIVPTDRLGEICFNSSLQIVTEVKTRAEYVVYDSA
jgi:hypothetical protein